MEEDRIMVLGAAGQVGQALRHVWDNLPEHPGWVVGWFDRDQFDMTDASALRDAMQNFRPHLVIHAAGYTDIDGAQDDDIGAVKTNFHATANLAAQCANIDARMIYISSAHVFDGQKAEAYQPDDLMNPVNQYGATKMMAEEALRHELPWHVILRTSAVFSPYGRNAMTQMLEDIKTQKEITAATDWTISPTPALDLAKAIFKIAEALLAGKVDGFGTYHYAGTPCCSNYTLLETIGEALTPIAGKRPRLNQALSADIKDKAPRPPYAALDCSKTERVFRLQMPDWRSSLDEAIAVLTGT